MAGTDLPAYGALALGVGSSRLPIGGSRRLICVEWGMTTQNIHDGKTHKQLVEDYLKREAVIDESMDDLRSSKKDLKEEFKDLIDLKVLAKAQRLVKARAAVEDKEEEMFLEMLELMNADLTLRVQLRQTG
jgi:urease accessory protein UreF